MDKIAASIAQIAAEVSAKADTAAATQMPEALDAALKAWIADQADPTLPRSEAIRRILTEHLTAKGYLK